MSTLASHNSRIVDEIGQGPMPVELLTVRHITNFDCAYDSLSHKGTLILMYQKSWEGRPNSGHSVDRLYPKTHPVESLAGS